METWQNIALKKNKKVFLRDNNSRYFEPNPTLNNLVR